VGFIAEANRATQDLIIRFLKGIDSIQRRLGIVDETMTRQGSIAASARDSAITELYGGTEQFAALPAHLREGLLASPEYRAAEARYSRQFQSRYAGADIAKIRQQQATALGLTLPATFAGIRGGQNFAGLLGEDDTERLGEFLSSGGGGGGGRAAAGTGRSQFLSGVFGAVTRWGRSQPGTLERIGDSARGLGSGLSSFFGGPAAAEDTGSGFSGLLSGSDVGQSFRDQKFEDFQKQMEDRATLVGSAFETMTAGLNAAVDAAITGSESIGKAWMKASAMALRALSIENTGRAATAGALAIGALFFNPAAAAGFAKQAAAHAAAAAITGAGAALLGAASGAFGGGGGGGGPGAAPGGGFASHRGGSGDGPTNITVNLHGFVGTNEEQAIAVIADGLEKGIAARRVRDPGRARSVRYAEI
jgi:hypothetical protein